MSAVRAKTLGWKIISNSSCQRSSERTQMKLKRVAGHFSQPEPPPAPQFEKSDFATVWGWPLQALSFSSRTKTALVILAAPTAPGSAHQPVQGSLTIMVNQA